MNNVGDQDNLSDRVKRTLSDLTAIRQSLLALSDEAADGAAPADLALDLELAGELKNVVDALRLLLWAYIRALSAKSGRAPHEVLSWYKMQLAVEMLRSVSSRSGQQDFMGDSVSSFNRLVTGALVVASRHTESETTH